MGDKRFEFSSYITVSMTYVVICNLVTGLNMGRMTLRKDDSRRAVKLSSYKATTA